MKRYELDGEAYEWDGRRWTSVRTHVTPPRALQAKLTHLMTRELAATDDSASLRQLVDRAREARQLRQHGRARDLATRALDRDRSHVGAAAILCAALRDLGEPELAIDQTRYLLSTGYAPLLTSHAAALCDLERWEDARRTVAPVLARGDSEEAFAVVGRIKQARPDLYAKKRGG